MLDRLVRYLKETKGLQIKRSRLKELLVAEGCVGANKNTGLASESVPTSLKKGGPHDPLQSTNSRDNRGVPR
jgi:hypothetical protein